jgi:hypothetical protein
LHEIAASPLPVTSGLHFLMLMTGGEPGKLERQCAVLVAHQDVDMVFGHYVEFASGDDDGEGFIARTNLAPGYPACAMLARRNLFERVGGFSETVRIGEFVDWYGRALSLGGRAIILDDLVFHRRVHRSNMTRVALDKREQYLAVIRAHLNRQRSQT